VVIWPFFLNFACETPCNFVYVYYIRMRLLDLYSGTHSVGSVAKEMGFQVISLDLSDADICTNIMDWNFKEFATGYFDVIWASPPCDTFSIARFKNIGRHNITRESIETDILEIGLPLLRKTEEILEYFKPKYYFIENPDSGAMKRFINNRHYYVVDYCMYGFEYRKRTRIWTNLLDFEPKVCNKICGAFYNGKHIRSAIGGNTKQKGQGSGINKSLRYRIPPLLIKDLFSRLT